MAVVDAPPRRARTYRQTTPFQAVLLDDPEWLEMVSADLTTTQIARRVGVAHSIVAKRLRKYGIEAASYTPDAASRARLSASGRVRAERGRPAELNSPGWLAQRLESGMSQTQIGNEIGVTQAAVWRAMARHGLKSPNPAKRITPFVRSLLADREWMQARRQEGMSAAALARRLDVCGSTVSDWWEHHGLKLRPEAREQLQAELRARWEAEHPELVEQERKRREEAQREWQAWCEEESNKRAAEACQAARERWQLENSERRRLHRVQRQAREERQRTELMHQLYSIMSEVHAIEIERERIRLTQLRPRLTAIAASLHSFQRREDPPAKTRELLAEARKMGLDFGVCFPVVIAVATEGVAMEGKWRESMRSMQGAWLKGWRRDEVCSL